MSEIEVDGDLQPRMVDLRGYGDAMTISATDARSAGLPVPDGATGRIRISSLRLVEWKFQSLTQRLIVSLYRNRDGANLRDLSAPNLAKAPVRNLTSLRIGYDISATMVNSRLRTAAALEASLSRGESAAVTQFNIYQTRAVRLDSFVQTRLPGTEVFARAGDFISAGSQAQRALRLAGIQLASSFINRPDLITTAMPAFSGAVAVPTDVDIITADRRLELGKVQPGDYLIRNIPSNMGRSSMDVVLRDALGRETVRTISFYRSATLLAPGLSSYALNAGFVRRNFGVASNDYGAFAATGYWRRGLSPFATVEASAEFSPGIANIGGRGDFTIGNVALVSVETRASADSVAGGGYLAKFTIESIGRMGGVSAGLTFPSTNYRDIANRLGDSTPPKQIFANLSHRLFGKIPLNLAYVQQRSRLAFPGRPIETNRLRMLTASTSFNPIEGMSVNFRSGIRAEQSRSFFANLGVTIPLGARQTVSASTTMERGDTENALGYSFNNQSPFGLQAHASVSRFRSQTRLAATGTYFARHADLQAGVLMYENNVVAQGSIRGSLIAVGNATYARNTSANGYALVRTGDVGDVSVKVESRAVGKTDRTGRLLVSDLSPRVPLRVSIDEGGLPLDALVLNTSRVTKLFPQSVGLVEFEARRFRPVLRSVVDAEGRPVDAGLNVVAYPSKIRSLVGYDGTVEINAAGGDRFLEIGLPGRTCRVDLPSASELETGTTSLACRPVTIAQQDLAEYAGKKVARRD